MAKFDDVLDEIKDDSVKAAKDQLQSLLQQRKAFFRAKFAAGLKDQLTSNYDQALRGEDIR